MHWGATKVTHTTLNTKYEVENVLQYKKTLNCKNTKLFFQKSFKGSSAPIQSEGTTILQSDL